MRDARGFDGFYRANHERVVRACALALLDTTAAEDVAADAFVRLWSHWGQVENTDHAGGYVFKTAMRLCQKEVRRRARWRLLPWGASSHEIDTVLNRNRIAQALADLSLRQRQVVILRDWAGWSTQEVATTLGIRESTARVHLARAHGLLRRELGDMEER
jgi:RNA polymerase sigma factor (sigma-70 family)